MERLVFVYNYGTCEGDCGTSIIPFEFSSKDDFVLEQLNKITIEKKISKFPTFIVLGVYLSFDFIENDLENSIYTLDEWFDNNKEN